MDTYIPCAGYLITEGVNPSALVFAFLYLVDLLTIGAALTVALGIAFSHWDYRKLLRPLALVAVVPLAGWMIAGTLFWRLQICEGSETVRGLFMWREQGPGLHMGVLAGIALVIVALIPRSGSGVVPMSFGKLEIAPSQRLVSTLLVTFAALVNIAAQWWPAPFVAGDFTTPSLLPGLAVVLVAVAFVVDSLKNTATQEPVIDLTEEQVVTLDDKVSEETATK